MKPNPRFQYTGAWVPENRFAAAATFRVKAKNAGKVQIDLGKVYNMAKMAITMTVTPIAGPRIPLLFSDYRRCSVADPASQSYTAQQNEQWNRVPKKDGLLRTQDVPHGEIRAKCISLRLPRHGAGALCTRRRLWYQDRYRYPCFIFSMRREDERAGRTGRVNFIMDKSDCEGKPNRYYCYG